MTFHVGINPSILYGLSYNTSNDEIIEFGLKWDYTKIDTTPSLKGLTNSLGISIPQPFAKFVGFKCIKEMYDDIKNKVPGKLGCLCIVLEKFNNSARKCFIKMGLEIGFKEVEIIDPQTSLYLHTTFYSNFAPKDGDFIGIILNQNCYLWKKENGKSKFIECLLGNFEDEENVEKFLLIWKRIPAISNILEDKEKATKFLTTWKSLEEITENLKDKSNEAKFESYIHQIQEVINEDDENTLKFLSDWRQIQDIFGEIIDEKSTKKFLASWKFAKSPNIFLCNKSNKALTKSLSSKYNFSVHNFQDFVYSLQFLNVHLVKSRTSLTGINKGSILYAQMMAAEFKASEYYDIQKTLDRNIKIKITYAEGLTPDWMKDKTTIAEIKANQELPSKCIIKIKNNGQKQKVFIEGEHIYQNYEIMVIRNAQKFERFHPNQSSDGFYELENEEQINFHDTFVNVNETGNSEAENISVADNTWTAKKMTLPEVENLMMIFTIDMNGIYDFEFKEALPESFSTTDEFLEAYCTISDSESFQIKDFIVGKEAAEQYIIPKDVFKNDDSIDAVGIDLGTTRCCVAVNRKNGIQTAPLDNTGERLLPSFVAFEEENEKCGQVVVDRLRNFAKSTVFDVKRLIGKAIEEITVDQSWGFTILTVNNKLKIQIEGPSGLITKHPEEISAALLKQIKRKTEEFQGKHLSEAVITIPAAFKKVQKDSTYASALITGWKKVHLLPEPIAAAFAYFANRQIPDNSNVLLFDLGGGTLDVCIFKIVKRQIEIIGRHGNPNLGGRDFDNILMNYLIKELKQKFNFHLPENKKCKLMLKCQEIKHTLTVMNEYSFEVSDIDPSKDDSVLIITRTEFEKLCKKLLEKIQTCISTALTETKVTADKMDKVLYVGGGCRMPMMKKLLNETFLQAEHCCEEHPDEVVAIGAAYYAFYLASNKGEKCSVM